jgi:transcriptional antiterminator NusG
MLIEEPSDKRTDAPEDASTEEVVPPPDRVGEDPGTEASAAEETAAEPAPEPEDVGSPPDQQPDTAEASRAEPEAVEDGGGVAEPPEVAVTGPEDEVPEPVEAEAAEVEEGLVEPVEATEVSGDGEAPAPVAEAQPEEPPAARDPFGGPGDWYVIHTYAGYENKVKTNLESRIHTMQMEEKIFDVHIPMEDVMEIKGGKKQVVQKKVFPGYLLVRMVYDDDSWYVVRNTPGVTGFVSSGTGQKPTPLSRREVEKILAVKEEEAKKPAFRLEFEEGDVVRIISGPFADFNGTISDINVDQSKLRVMVNIFDRETPVELGFDQVAKV